MEAEEKLREQLAKIVCESQEGEEWMYCTKGQKDFCYIFANQILSLIKEAGYLSVEPVQLEVLEFTQEQILGLIPAQAILDYKRAKEVLDKVSQATITHNEAKGQLYRRKERKIE